MRKSERLAARLQIPRVFFFFSHVVSRSTREIRLSLSTIMLHWHVHIKSHNEVHLIHYLCTSISFDSTSHSGVLRSVVVLHSRQVSVEYPGIFSQ